MTDNDGTQDFRDSATFLDELDDGLPPKQGRGKRAPKSAGKVQSKERGLFGLQPGQAFILSAMLFFLVFLVGAAILIVAGKMTLPF